MFTQSAQGSRPAHHILFESLGGPALLAASPFGTSNIQSRLADHNGGQVSPLASCISLSDTANLSCEGQSCLSSDSLTSNKMDASPSICQLKRQFNSENGKRLIQGW